MGEHHHSKSCCDYVSNIQWGFCFGAWLIIGNALLIVNMIFVSALSGFEQEFSIFIAVITLVGLAETALLVTKFHFQFEVYEYKIKGLFWLISWTQLT